jgi:ubiquinol-cytochrome c reductase cytochrome b subunit
MRGHHKIQLLTVVNQHLVGYGTPVNLNWNWNWGSLAGLMLTTQILTGILVSMHYVSHAHDAFLSVQHLQTEVPGGLVLRNAHANGASLFFAVVYLHILRGIYARSGVAPREMVWLTGVVLLLGMIATAFIGYVLPWGQMSFWGATVMTSLATSIAVVGQELVQVLWGGFSVDNPTLQRFYSIHYVLPFVLAGLSVFHIAALHVYGSTNPLGVNHESAAVAFWTYFGAKDLLGVIVAATILGGLVFFAADALGHPENAMPANPYVTPAHIVPEWYFLWVYAILRSIPNKAMGVLMILLVFAGLAVLPFTAVVHCGSTKFRPISEWLFWTFVADLLLLTLLGGMEIQPITILWAQVCTVYLLIFIFMGLPLISRFEK